MKTFRSRIDAWLGVFLVACICLCAGAAYTSWSQSLPIAIIVALSGVLLPGWILLDTHYRIDDTHLLIRSGPLRWKVALTAITAVTTTRSVVSGPALSLDRLRIDYSPGGSVLVSPRHKDEFLQLLNRQCSV